MEHLITATIYFDIDSRKWLCFVTLNSPLAQEERTFDTHKEAYDYARSCFYQEIIN